MVEAKKQEKTGKAGIKPPKMEVVELEIEGTAPYVQHKFSEKAKRMMEEKHREGSQKAGKKKAKPPRDFEADFEGATHRGKGGELGIPATAFRNAMIDACRLVGFKMTMAKQAIFVEQDTFDPSDGTPLIFIEGEREMLITPVPNETGVVDLRSRPKWDPGWKAKVRVRYDADIFTAAEVRALLERAGIQCGVGEGRPFSRRSFGCGWGTFTVL